MSSRSRSTPSARACPAAAAARSSALIAAAIHVTGSGCSGKSGPSALTTPPAPRCATNDPSRSRTNPNGPRWETTIIGWPSQRYEQAEPVFELACREERMADVLATVRAHLVGTSRVVQEFDG